MAADRFDHLFIAPGSYDASLRFYRETSIHHVGKDLLEI
jgi:hypothetical protein